MTEEQQEEGKVYGRLKRLRTARDARQYMQALVEAFERKAAELIGGFNKLSS